MLPVQTRPSLAMFKRLQRAASFTFYRTLSSEGTGLSHKSTESPDRARKQELVLVCSLLWGDFLIPLLIKKPEDTPWLDFSGVEAQLIKSFSFAIVKHLSQFHFQFITCHEKLFTILLNVIFPMTVDKVTESNLNLLPSFGCWWSPSFGLQLRRLSARSVVWWQLKIVAENPDTSASLEVHRVMKPKKWSVLFFFVNFGTRLSLLKWKYHRQTINVGCLDTFI